MNGCHTLLMCMCIKPGKSMNANFNQLIGSAAMIFAMSSTTFAQTNSCPPKKPAPCCYEQGYGLCDDKIPPAYNGAARFDVQCAWDFFMTGSFIYWHADQEGMDLAYPEDLGTGYPLNDQIEIQKFEFKPGFKVGLGMNFEYDNWVGALEYTWFRQQTQTSKTAPSGRHWQMTDWYATGGGIIATSFDSKWRTHFDVLDATMSRPYYQSRKITITPFGGMRAAWIRQSLYIKAIFPGDRPWISDNHSHCWSVGPRAGLQAHWLLGAGFRMEGDFSGSLLFTRFTEVSHKEYRCSLKYRDYNSLRPMTDMSVGLGWGSYFDHQNYHLDFLAAYDFNVMWGQNMMRSLVGTLNDGTTSEAANLHLQGLTATARFDF